MHDKLLNTVVIKRKMHLKITMKHEAKSFSEQYYFFVVTLQSRLTGAFQ